MEKGLLIKTEQLNGKMVTFLLYKNIYFLNSFVSNIITLCAVSLAYRELTSRYDTHIVRKRIAMRYDFSESLQL